MAISNVPVMAQLPRAIMFQFTTAFQTTTQAFAPSTVYVSSTGSGVGASKITALWASNSDAVAHNVTVELQRSGVVYGGCMTSIPASAGFSTAAPPINILSTSNWPGLPPDNGAAGAPYLYLGSTLDELVALYATTLTTGTVVNVCGVAKDF